MKQVVRATRDIIVSEHDSAETWTLVYDDDGDNVVDVVEFYNTPVPLKHTKRCVLVPRSTRSRPLYVLKLQPGTNMSLFFGTHNMSFIVMSHDSKEICFLNCFLTGELLLFIKDRYYSGKELPISARFAECSIAPYIWHGKSRVATLFKSLTHLSCQELSGLSFVKFVESARIHVEQLEYLEIQSLKDINIEKEIYFFKLKELVLTKGACGNLDDCITPATVCKIFPKLSRVRHLDEIECRKCTRFFEYDTTLNEVYGPCMATYLNACREYGIQNRTHVYAILRRVFPKDIARFMCQNFIPRFCQFILGAFYILELAQAKTIGYHQKIPSDAHISISYNEYVFLEKLTRHEQKIQSTSYSLIMFRDKRKQEETDAMQKALDAAIETFIKLRKLGV